VNQRTRQLAVAAHQRSHLLLVLSEASLPEDEMFLAWYRDGFGKALRSYDGVLRVAQYVQHEFDITGGRYMQLPFGYLTLCDLSLDGAAAAEHVIRAIHTAHERERSVTGAPATWMYYPASEKVGISARDRPPLLTIAFANGLAGSEEEFREWYATQHVRHALNIPALVSGQIFARTGFQLPGAIEALFSVVAIYEVTDEPQSIVKAFSELPAGLLTFPTLDTQRFAEVVYRAI
jgi:hypothetical protein